MKKQKFELSHDIIAEKIWQRLPEQDKQLRQIQRSLRQRYEDYRSGKGSLLGKAELGAWEIYLPMLELTDGQRQYVHESSAAINAARLAERERLEKEKAQIARNRRLQRLIAWGLSILSLLIFGLLLYSLNSRKEAKKQSDLATASRATADSLLLVAREANRLAERTADKARQDSSRAAAATLRALLLTEESQKDSLKVAELLKSLGITERELNERHSAFLASEARNAFENNNYTLSFRLAKLALEKDENNLLAQDLLKQIPPYLSDLQLDKVRSAAALDSSSYWALSLDGAKGEQFELLNTRELTSGGLPDSLSQPATSELSPDKRFIAYTVNGQNGTSFLLWDLQQDQNISLNGLQPDSVHHSDFSTDGRYLSLQGNQQPWPGLSIWDLNAQKRVFAVAKGVEDFRFSSGNRYLAVLLHGTEEAQLQVWDLERQEALLSIDDIPYTRGGSYSYLNSYRFDPCDRYFAALKQTGSSTDLEVWDLRTAQLVQRIQNIAYSSNDRYQFRFSFENSFQFSPDCTELAVLVQGDQYIQVELWKPGSNRADHIVNGLAVDRRSRTDYSYRDSYVFSPDGRYFVVMTDVDGERQLQLRELSTFEVMSYFPYPASFTFSADSRFFAVREDDKLVIWDLDKGDILQNFSNISANAFSGDGQLLVVRTKDQKLQIWDLDERKIVLTKELVESYEFSPEEKYLAIYSATQARPDQLQVLASPFDRQPILTVNMDKANFDFNEAGLLAVQYPQNVITIYDLQTGVEIRRVLHKSDITEFSFSEGSPYLISLSENGILKVTNTRTRTEEILPYYDSALPALDEEALRLRYGITE